MRTKGEAFLRKLSAARLRLDLAVLGDQMGLSLALAGAAALTAILLQRAAGLETLHAWLAWTLGGAAAVLTGGLWALRRPSRMRAALVLDERLATKDSFSTALVLSGRDDPFSRASVRQTESMAASLSLKGRFPYQPGKRWYAASGTWVLAAAAMAFMPQLDLLGKLKQQAAEQKARETLAETKAEVREVTGPVRAVVSKLNDPDLGEQAEQLGKPPSAAMPDDLKREAIRKLGDMSDRIKQLQSRTELQKAAEMREMMKQLRTTRDGLSNELSQSLAKGEFAKAAAALRELQQKVAESQLTPEQEKALQKQLADLAEQLKKLADEDKQLEEELEQAGLDKDLARLGDKDLREALKKKGLSDEQIEEMLKKASACRSACRACSGLGRAMSACGGGSGGGGLSADELGELIEQLDDLEALKMQLELSECSMNEINNAIACLGKSMCQGGGCCTRPGSCPGPGALGNSGGASVGPGAGWGHVENQQEEVLDAETVKTKSKSKTGEGPIIASWYFKGPQAEGEASRDLTDVVQAAKDRASEAITESRIPRRYEGSVKKYFSDLSPAEESQ